MHEVIEKAEEYFLELVSRIEEGDEEALGELKELKRYMADINSILDMIEENDTIETIKAKFDSLEERFDRLMMEIHRVVG